MRWTYIAFRVSVADEELGNIPEVPNPRLRALLFTCTQVTEATLGWGGERGKVA